MRPFLFFIACTLGFTALSCSKVTDSKDAQGPNSPESEKTTPLSEADPDDHVPITDFPGASLSQGTLTVFGLSLPKGMLPLSSRGKVYTFEGDHPTEMVFKDIERQVSSRWIGPEGDGYLVRKARVRNPKGKATGEEVVALRIKKRDGGGSLVDVWLESSYVAKKSGSNQSGATSYPKGDLPKPTRAPTTWTKDTKESRQQTLRVMGKLSRGEELTKEELKSSAFH